MGSDIVDIDRPETAGDGGAGGERGPGSRWRLVAALVAAVALIAATVVVLVNRDGDEDVATEATTTSTQAEPSTTAEPGTSTSVTSSASTPAVEPSAADSLEPFFAAAATMDEQLHDAAAAINGSGPPWETVTDEVAGSVRAADAGPVAEAIPAGLPTDLLQSVILVYSDLSSRRAAMQSFALATTEPGQDLVAELGNGHAAAARFDGDLTAARSLAASTPPITVAPSDSREAAEVLLLVEYVDTLNSGCGSRGGAVVTELPPIVWLTNESGTIAGIEFDTALGADGQWDVNIHAC